MSVWPFLHSIISFSPTSLYRSFFLSHLVSRQYSVFPQCLVIVTDFVSIQWLISKTYALSHCVCVSVGISLCLCIKHQQSMILRKLLCLNSRHKRSTFYFLTRVFASPADFITCIICMLLASISQCAFAFCHTMSHPLPLVVFSLC